MWKFQSALTTSFIHSFIHSNMYWASTVSQVVKSEICIFSFTVTYPSWKWRNWDFNGYVTWPRPVSSRSGGQAQDYLETSILLEIDASQLLFRFMQYYKIDAFSSDNFMTNESRYKLNPYFKVQVNYILDMNILIFKEFIISYESYLLMCQRIRVEQSKFQTSKLIFKNHIKSSWRFLLVKSPCYKMFSSFLQKDATHYWSCRSRRAQSTLNSMPCKVNVSWSDTRIKIDN